MALTDFYKRTISSVFFVIIMLGSLLHILAFVAVMIFILVGSVIEFFKLVKPNTGKFSIFDFIKKSLFAFAYIIIPITLLIIFCYTTSPFIVLAILLTLWINDSGAYIIGSLIGNHLFCPKISPKKTWEGTAGGFVLSMVLAFLFYYVIPKLSDNCNYSLLFWLIFTAVVSIFGIIGDLFESMLKRKAGVKDSGNIMPGHGGFLDRFDSLLFATIGVTILLLITN